MMQAPSVPALIRRSAVLFVIGVGFALVLNLLQVQRKVINFPTEVISNLFTCAWWVPVFCGLASSFIGLLYPLLDSLHGYIYRQEWPAVMRCVAVFLGINHASAKIDFANNMQLTLTLAVMSVGLWYLFDRSRSGLGVGLGVAVLATLVTQILVYHGVYQYTEPDFLYVRSWLPCIFFSGGVTMGTIGRQLALSDQMVKQHRD